MAKDQLNQIYKNYFTKNNFAVFGKIFALLLFLTLSSSCTDSGCIDADDFGEYESQTLEVLSNASQDACTYDITKSIDDSSQGSGIKTCLTSGTPSVIDENDVTTTASSGGCNAAEFAASAKLRTLCAQQCVESCVSQSSQSSGNSEPRWTSTDQKVAGKNVGVTIRPGAKVIIRAIGSVTLGDTFSYPNIFVAASSPIPTSSTSSWGNLFFDAKAGQTLSVDFSGQWSDGTNTFGSGNGSITSNTYNGARRLAIYLIPHTSNYSFNTATATSEQSGASGAPIWPDAGAWSCTYTGTTPLTQSTCGNTTNGYAGLGYDASLDTNNGVFPISSAYKSSGLAYYGGAIRWLGDGLQDNTFDPFTSISCANSGCPSSAISLIPASQGALIGDASASNITFTNSYDYAYRVSFRSLLSGACGTTTTPLSISVQRQDSSGSNIGSAIAVSVTNSYNTTPIIEVESGHKIVITSFSNATPSGTNCGKLIGMRFGQYHDIEVKTSGILSFAMLGGSGASGSCALKGRIINPTGSHTDISSGFTADFYEYHDFGVSQSSDSPALTDPLSTISLTASTSTKSWSGEVFVRKGQKIRFAPESWNGTWVAATGLNRQCGVGAVMKILPRPALLCRGRTSDYVSNPDCIIDTNTTTGAITGCQASTTQCNDSSTTSTYCPITDCQNAITSCVAGTAPTYTKTGCVLGSLNNSGTNCPLNASPPPSPAPSYTTTTCTACSNAAKAKALLPAKVLQADMDQCYDLENYTGKVANIPSAAGFTTTQLDASNATTYKAKGAIKLSNFNGEYGNFDGFYYNTTDAKTDVVGSNTNKVYSSKLTLTFPKAGRVRFMVLSGNNFLNLSTKYSGNTAAGASYTGLNGMKISTSGMLEFNNGTWLQARLCKETSTTSVVCKNNAPVSLNGTPKIIDITAPASPSDSPTITSPYSFDSVGNLIRRSGAIYSSGATNDCTIDNSGISTTVGSNYYCHKYDYYTPAEMKAAKTAAGVTIDTDAVNADIALLRISFKILDPETGNCSTAGNGTNDGVKTVNPIYKNDCNTSNPTDSEAVPKNGYTVVTQTTCASGSAGRNDTTGKCPVVTCSSNTGNDTATCSSTESPSLTPSPSTNTVCHKKYYCANKYSNNSGKYYVAVKVKSPVSGKVSSIIGQVITPIIEVMDGKQDGSTVGQAERIYKLLISDPRYKAILTVSLILMFSFYGFGYLMGVSELNHSELLNRIIKIGLIYLFVGEAGWYWFDKFVVKLFKNSTDYLSFMMASSFDNSTALSNAIAGGNYYDKSILFSGVDNVFGMFFSQAVQNKIGALLFASIFGWAYLLIIYNSFMLYVYAVSNAVLLYLTAQVFISILFTLGPIFFVFTLFSQTKEMFDNWLKQLIGFSLQQIFLLTTLAFFNMLMYEVIKLSLGYKICWDDVWTINIITRITLMSFWTIASLPPRTNAQSEVGNIGNPEGIPSLFSILFIWVIASLMNKFIGFMTDLASSISGGLSASSLGSGLKEAVGNLQKFAAKRAGEAWKATGGQVAQRLDKALFDSGELAERERKEKKAQATKDNNNRSALTKAGKESMNKYKRENASALSKMTQDEQKKALTKARDAGISKEGEKRGLGKEEIEKLKNQKGLNTAGEHNLIKNALTLAKQATTSGGSLRNSINEKHEKSDSTKFSQKEAKQAMKTMSKSERDDFVKNAAKGAVKIEKGNFDKLKDAAKSATGIKEGDGALKSAAKIVVAPLSAPVRAAVSAIKSKAEKMKAFNKAADELRKDGTISTMTKGFGRFRKDSELKQIHERVEKNEAAKNIDVVKNTAGSVAALAQQNRTQTSLEDGKETSTTRAKGTLAAAILGSEKSSPLESFKERGSLQESIAASGVAKEGLAEQFTSQYKAAEKVANSKHEAKNKAFAELAKVEETLKPMEEARQKHLAASIDPTKSNAEREQSKKEADKIITSEDYVKAKTQAQQIGVAARQLKEEEGDAMKKMDKIESMAKAEGIDAKKPAAEAIIDRKEAPKASITGTDADPYKKLAEGKKPDADAPVARTDNSGKKLDPYQELEKKHKQEKEVFEGVSAGAGSEAKKAKYDPYTEESSKQRESAKAAFEGATASGPAAHDPYAIPATTSSAPAQSSAASPSATPPVGSSAAAAASVAAPTGSGDSKTAAASTSGSGGATVVNPASGSTKKQRFEYPPQRPRGGDAAAAATAAASAKKPKAGAAASGSGSGGDKSGSKVGSAAPGGKAGDAADQGGPREHRDESAARTHAADEDATPPKDQEDDLDSTKAQRSEEDSRDGGEDANSGKKGGDDEREEGRDDEGESGEGGGEKDDDSSAEREDDDRGFDEDDDLDFDDDGEDEGDFDDEAGEEGSGKKEGGEEGDDGDKDKP